MHYLQVSGPDPAQVRAVSSHVLALWCLGAIDLDVASVSLAWDVLDPRVPLRHRDVVLADGSGRLDVSRQEISAVADDVSPYDWLWTVALPGVLPARLVEMIRREYQTRDRFRQRRRRMALRDDGEKQVSLW